MKFPFCKICKGKCCKGAYLSLKELKKIKPTLIIKVSKRLYRFLPINGKCQFLENGCTLTYKPLQCVIYPFKPTKTGWTINTECPFWYKLTPKDLKKVKREFAKRRDEWMELKLEEPTEKEKDISRWTRYQKV